MKIRRVARPSTLKKYEDVLRNELIPQYMKKSRSKEPVEEVIGDLNMGCANDAFVYTCMVLDDADRPVGFLVCHLSVSCHGRQLIFDHVYVPNMDMVADVVDLMMSKLEAHTSTWITFRDPSGWIRLGDKTKHPVELYGWALKFTKRQ